MTDQMSIINKRKEKECKIIHNQPKKVLSERLRRKNGSGWAKRDNP
jgi:hypothetical protein